MFSSFTFDLCKISGRWINTEVITLYKIMIRTFSKHLFRVWSKVHEDQVEISPSIEQSYTLRGNHSWFNIYQVLQKPILHVCFLKFYIKSLKMHDLLKKQYLCSVSNCDTKPGDWSVHFFSVMYVLYHFPGAISWAISLQQWFSNSILGKPQVAWKFGSLMRKSSNGRQASLGRQFAHHWQFSTVTCRSRRVKDVF